MNKLGFLKLFILCQTWTGFIFTAPKIFLSGHDENVCISFKNDVNVAEVKVAILQLKEDIEIALAVEKITEFDYDGKCFKISMPRTKVKKGRLQLTVRLKTEGDLNINYVQHISIETNPDITFIQTDKPLYNGGQLVQFRIFTLKSDLKPDNDPIDKIWIENPSGIHLTQWLNEFNSKGIINKTFQLSKEPIFGKWSIKMKKKNSDVIVKNFFVENYILPKFSVLIKSPEYITNTANLTICAKYHFGEPVHGNVILQYFIKCTFSYYCQEKASSVTQNLRLGVDGCLQHEISLKNPSNFAHSLIINATVTEDGTYLRGKAFSKINIRNSKFSNYPEFSLDTVKKKFKPGLPFTGKVMMKMASLSREQLIVCLDSNEIINCKELFLKNGTSKFLISPINISDEKNFRISIKVRNSKDNLLTKVEETKLSLVPWYSPSGSYLQIEKLTTDKFTCNQNGKFKVLYTSSDNDVKFHYLVKSRGVILSAGTLDKFSADAKLYEVEEGISILNEGNLKNVKQFEFEIFISSLMSPYANVIIYFITKDGEVVADTFLIPVEKCLPNRVKTKWSKGVTSPGSNNNFQIETFQNSICALSITDKSVHMFSNLNEVNSDKVFKELEKFANKPDFLTETTSEHCQQNKEMNNQFIDGKMEALSEPKPLDSRFVDSLQAFKDFGALVITDLKLETRPCAFRNQDSQANVTTKNSGMGVFDNKVENITLFKAEEFPDAVESNKRESPYAYELRTFFPETWIWDLINIDSSGIAKLDYKVPHTVTEWLTNTICLSSEKGLGIAEHSRLTTYQPFFLHFFIPHTLHKREIFHMFVSVFNYESTELPIKIKYISTANFNSKSDEVAFYCIKAKTKIVHRFVLEAVKLGEAEIAVKGEIDLHFKGNCNKVNFSKSDVVIKKTMVKHEGILMEENKSGFICGESSNFYDKIDWTIRVPPEIVESSVSVDAFVSGDILGPTLKEKLIEEDSSKSLSAYILISLIEAGISKDSPIVKNTIFCLKPNQESLGLYGDVLLSYALILAGEYRESQTLMFELLKEAKRTYGLLWWEADGTIESAIETTSYGILTLVKLGGPHFLAAASDAIRWLIQHQNQYGGFVSSQDTVLALEAISKFSATLPRTNEYDSLRVNVSASDKRYSFNISHPNKMLQQKVRLPPFVTDIHFESSGKGCALVKTSLRYYVKKGKPNDDLKIQLRIHSVSDLDSYSIAKFHICVRYKSGKEKINMAVLEVSMVSGYYPDRSSLYEIPVSRKGVRRWEEYEDKINFYFEDLKNKKVCVDFLVVQETCVRNPAPALVKLYDYYDAKRQTTMKYNFTSECENESWLEVSDNSLKRHETKRELKNENGIYEYPNFQSDAINNGLFQGFSNRDQDLDTPSGFEGVMPVYALPPNLSRKGLDCVHCLTNIPEIFPKLYCSSFIALKVSILSNETMSFDLNVTPRSNFTILKRSVSFTVDRNCECFILNSDNNKHALLMVTPPRSFSVNTVQEIHLDNSMQLYPWGDQNQIPKYLMDAIEYCQKWSLD
ncbi:Ovostatin precursor, putative [Pediculus humanus corporis]|uniref:TEP1-F n=1 Tax=Pediculus humanus subsp. corporis TaxID=121224 RepID=E0VLL9_PEDHC|nr:Ovostatin precursor, putative [Pediculus humanus corporis]EEB14275.1 Ovostatin precursor, putative [Pediculus humanus corporis]